MDGAQCLGGAVADAQAGRGVGNGRGEGYYRWLATWTTEFYEATLAAYPFADRAYGDIRAPERVLAGPGGGEARALPARLAEREGAEVPAEVDAAFDDLARRRREALPGEVWLHVPARRAGSMWFAPAFSFGWQTELGPEVQARVLEDGWHAVVETAREAPVATAGKAGIAGYRALLVLALVFATAVAVRSGGAPAAVLGAVLAYAVAKTVLVALLGHADPRLTVQPYALIAVGVILFLAAPAPIPPSHPPGPVR